MSSVQTPKKSKSIERERSYNSNKNKNYSLPFVYIIRKNIFMLSHNKAIINISFLFIFRANKFSMYSKKKRKLTFYSNTSPTTSSLSADVTGKIFIHCSLKFTLTIICQHEKNWIRKIALYILMLSHCRLCYLEIFTDLWKISTRKYILNLLFSKINTCKISLKFVNWKWANCLKMTKLFII